MKLAEKKCVSCEGGVPSLKPDEIKVLQQQLHKDWLVLDHMKLVREFKFVNFRQTMNFVNQVAEVAEAEGHHPDLHISYANLRLELWTHAIQGLSENDFILASKIDLLR